MRPLTPREELIGALVRCDRAGHDLHKALLSTLAVRVQVAELAEALSALIQAGEMLDRSVPEDWLATGYGLPPWLCTDPGHGTFLVLELLMQDEWRSQVTSHADAADRPVFGEGDVDLFLDVMSRLQAALTPLERPHLLPGRIGDPGLGYRDLVSALLGEDHALAAASAVAADPGTAASRLAARFAAWGPEQPVGRELLARLLRVEVPVIHQSAGAGMLLGLEVELSALDDAREQVTYAVGDGRRLKAFRDGVAVGHRNALELLKSIRTPESWLAQVRSLEFRLAEVAEGSPDATGDSAGLPVALRVVAQALGLEPPPWVVTGSFEKDGTIKPLDADAARIKAEAVAADGLWQGLGARFAGPAPAGRVLPLTGSTLADVCVQLWPDEWPLVRARIARWHLDSSGCTVQVGVPADPHALTDAHGAEVGVPAAPHDEVMGYLRDYPEVPVVLAGPPCVGKSWTIRSVASDLKREGWSILVLRFRDNYLPPAAEAAWCAEMALQLHPSAEPAKSLIILEDLQASPDATDLESVLFEILNACKCPVSAVVVAQQGSGQKWKQASLHVVRMPFDTDSLATLARSLVGAYPERFGAAAGREGPVAEASRGDRWWLVRLLEYTARRDNSGELASPNLRQAYLAERVGDLDPDQWNAAELLAAFSEIGLPAPAPELHPLDSAQLRRLGAYQAVSGPDIFWQLPSPAARAAILRRKGGSVEAQLRAPLGKILGLLLEGTDMGPVVQCLQHLKGVFDSRLLDSVSNDHRDTLVRRLKHHAEAIELGRAIPLLSGLPSQSQDELAQQLAERLRYRGWPTTRASELISCLAALEAHDLALAQSESDDSDDLWETLLQGLQDALQQLTSPMNPEEALGLLRRLRWLRRSELTGPLVTFVCIEGLGHADPARSADIFTALAMVDVVKWLAPPDRPRNVRTPLEELVNSNGWKRLVGPHRGFTNASEYLARLALRDLAPLSGGAAPTPEEVETQLLALLPRTPLAGFTHTLFQLRKHYPAVLSQMRLVRLDRALEGRLNVEAPHAVANLVRLLAVKQPQTAGRLLYDTTGRPRATLVESLVSRLERSGDLRTLGFVLEGAGTVDEEFFRGYRGFGELLVSRLRPMFDYLPNQRARVVLILARSLISVDFDGEHLRALQPRFRDYLYDAFARDSYGGEEAETALMLAADNALDGVFLTELREALDKNLISRSKLLYRMKRGQTPGALVHYHRLALALDPDMASSYRSSRPTARALVSSLKGKRLPDVLDAVLAVSSTLAYAGDDTAAHGLLHAIESTPQGWARRLLQLNHPKELARAVNVLAELNPPLAMSVLEETAQTLGERKSGLLKVVLDGEATPEEGLELLAAVQSVHPEIGRRLAGKISADERLWRRQKRGLLLVDHPAVLGQALRRVTELGFHLAARDLRDLEHIWSDTVRYMASPWTVGQLLLGVAAVDADLGARLADRVDADRLQSRLARVRSRDGGGISHLLRGLTQTGRPDVARSIVGQLAQTPLTALSPRQAVDLCRVVLYVGCGDSAELAWRLHDDVLLPALDRRLVPDPDEHLIDIGWLARFVQLLGCAPPDKRWRSNGLEHRAARLWAETWLAPKPERAAEVNRLLDDAAGCSRPARSWRSALVLVAAVRAGRLTDVLANGVDPVAAQGAGPEWRAELKAVTELLRAAPVSAGPS